MVAGLDPVMVAVILGMEGNVAVNLGRWSGDDLDLRIRRDGDIEDLAVLGEPRVGPAAIVADTDWCLAMDDSGIRAMS